MASSDGHFLDPGRPRYPGSPWSLVGFALGLLALSPGAVLYYWFFAPIVPLALSAVLRIVGRSPRMRAIAEGALSAALFGVAAVIVFLLGVGTVSPR